MTGPSLNSSPSENVEVPAVTSMPSDPESTVQWWGILIFLLALIATGLFGTQRGDEPSQFMEIGFALSAAVLLSTILWQACDPFAEAAQWFGEYWRIPGSVRGATLDAVASSMPELFTGLFFVLVAIWGDRTLAERLQHSTAGYGSTIATCAGSAIYNLILIPALCCLALATRRGKEASLNVETDVLARDGNWVLFTQFGLLVILFMPRLHWWMAVAGLLAYLGYVVHLALATRAHRRRLRQAGNAAIAAAGNTSEPSLDADSPALDGTQPQADSPQEDDVVPEIAPILFGSIKVPMNAVSSIVVLLGCTALAAGACYFLVEITNELSGILQVPAFFVSVILVASVSSVPDTLLSVGAARRGDDAGAISNVFGSNIFDICVGMSLPLLVCCYLNGWDPIELQGKHEETMNGVTGLRILLFVMTAIVMFLFWKNRRVTVNMAIFFCLLYLVFIGYAVAGGLGWSV